MLRDFYWNVSFVLYSLSHSVVSAVSRTTNTALLKYWRCFGVMGCVLKCLSTFLDMSLVWKHKLFCRCLQMDNTFFLQWKPQPDATVYQNCIIPYFKWSSTCFGRHTAHYQEPKTAQAASGFAYVEGCRTCSCWTLLGSVRYVQLLDVVR
jgi:hypothetical protein